ncbi:MAG: trypsin-like peptidase domain-containing protein [Acidobacteriota bacterium]
MLVAFAVILPARSLVAQRPDDTGASATGLRELSASVERLTKQVSQSVVQVQVTGYGPVDSHDTGETNLVLGRRHGSASGVIVDADGYIVTNAHVVAGAERVQVVLHGAATDDGPIASVAAERGQTVDAMIVGTARDLDLALLKIDTPGLRALPIADYNKVRQGELVFAIGSPEGLRNSITMGVVSAVARQTDPNSPNVYIQTDAAINPGSSGGPLVNIDGELVGLNTFIISNSGGNQGLGFAIPSSILASAYPELREHGRLHRGFIGISVQAITPALAAGLDLSKTPGVVVADVTPEGPADGAGVLVQDVVVSVDGRPVPSVPAFGLALNTIGPGDTVKLGLERGTETLTVTIPVVDRPEDVDQLADLADPAKNSIQELGIVGADVTASMLELLPKLRIASGVAVAAKAEDVRRHDRDAKLLVGDVIHAVNGFAVRSIDGLRVLLSGLKQDGNIVLQVERNNHLMFVTCRRY